MLNTKEEEKIKINNSLRVDKYMCELKLRIIIMIYKNKIDGVAIILKENL